jgi:hypothetical protein
MLNLDERLNKITDDMKHELFSAGAIGAKGQVVNQAEFNRIIDEKIKMCYSMAQELETSGKRFDANDNNKILSTIDLLRAIKGSQSLNPYAYQGPDREKEIIEKYEKKKPFLEGLKNLFTKHKQGKSTPNHSR